jgi:uncharacterized protein (DUF983 family)
MDHRAAKEEPMKLSENVENIEFREKSSNPADFIFELSDSSGQKHIKKNFNSSAAEALRRQQVARLEANIVLLRKKQEEFNRKMEDYIQNIRTLIGCLHRAMASERRQTSEKYAQPQREGTQVRCLTCGQEKLFKDFMVLLARDSTKTNDQTTELIVNDGGKIKKGFFQCPQCGNKNLLIRKINIFP